MDNALECIHSRPLGDVPLCREPGGDNEVLGRRRSPIGRFDLPAAFVCVKAGLHHHAVEGAVLLYLEHLVDVVKVSPQLLVVGVVCRPGPILPGLGNRVPVLWDFRVHRGSWITVPAPGAADIIARFVYDGLETQLTHLVKAVDAAEAGSHDDDIDAEVISVGSSRASKGGIFAKFLPDMHVEIALESVTFQLRCSRT